MSLNRTILSRGPALVSYNGATLWTRDDIDLRHAPVWSPVKTAMYGEVDQFKRDLIIKIPLRLWGAWENLGTLFPSSVTNPVIGASIYGGSDVPLTVLARNGDQITYANAQITRLADLYLGADSELFAADVEFTALLANGVNPETANAYYTVQTGQAYSDNAFTKANFKKVRWTGAWGGKSGFTTIVPQKGFSVAWKLELRPVTADGYGTIDLTLAGLAGGCRCIPLAPTLAQIEAQTDAQGAAFGTLLSAGAADLTLAGGASSVVLKNAGMTQHGYVFGVEPLRVGEVAWSTTRGFSAGVPAAVAVLS
jgi:hypothetical protein